MTIKDQAYYEALGYSEFEPGKPWPYDPKGSSWQTKARRAGWCRAEKDMRANELAAEQPPVLQSVRKGVFDSDVRSHHIELLRKDCLHETNMKRKMRLLVKVNKLERRNNV